MTDKGLSIYKVLEGWYLENRGRFENIPFGKQEELVEELFVILVDLGYTIDDISPGIKEKIIGYMVPPKGEYRRPPDRLKIRKIAEKIFTNLLPRYFKNESQELYIKLRESNEGAILAKKLVQEPKTTERPESTKVNEIDPSLRKRVETSDFDEEFMNSLGIRKDFRE